MSIEQVKSEIDDIQDRMEESLDILIGDNGLDEDWTHEYMIRQLIGLWKPEMLEIWKAVQLVVADEYHIGFDDGIQDERARCS